MADNELTDEEKREAQAEKLRQLEALLGGMSNEDIAKLLLNKSLAKLALLIEDDMATAADYNVVRQFLKDNNIGIVPTRTNVAGQLQAKLDAAAARRNQTKGVINVDELDNVDVSDFMARH